MSRGLRGHALSAAIAAAQTAVNGPSLEDALAHIEQLEARLQEAQAFASAAGLERQRAREAGERAMAIVWAAAHERGGTLRIGPGALERAFNEPGACRLGIEDLIDGGVQYVAVYAEG